MGITSLNSIDFAGYYHELILERVVNVTCNLMQSSGTIVTQKYAGQANALLFKDPLPGSLVSTSISDLATFNETLAYVTIPDGDYSINNLVTIALDGSESLISDVFMVQIYLDEDSFDNMPTSLKVYMEFTDEMSAISDDSIRVQYNAQAFHFLTGDVVSGTTVSMSATGTGWTQAEPMTDILALPLQSLSLDVFDWSGLPIWRVEDDPNIAFNNYIGTYLRFNRSQNSGQFLTIF